MDQATDIIEGHVIGYFAELFQTLFTRPFKSDLPSPRKRRAVERLIDEAADAASQSVTRLFINQRLEPDTVAAILHSLDGVGSALSLEAVANANVAPESIRNDLLETLPAPVWTEDGPLEPIRRVALHGIVQVLTLVGPIIAQWQQLGFAETFELPRRVVRRLNQITEQLDALGHAGKEAADERFELTYRDYLMQRFHRVEAGTVKMTTNLAVDLRELFVMPRLLERDPEGETADDPTTGCMNLSAARRRFDQHDFQGLEDSAETDGGVPAIEVLQRSPRLVLVGAPGSGKSTFLEWLQLQVASVEIGYVLADAQAIPLLLRVRQLDPDRLPEGADLVAVAMASADQARLMPDGWVERQMSRGRVLFMLDGLDEVEPAVLHGRIVPWLDGICRRHPACHYVLSSRPAGYAGGTLRTLDFAEADLADFDRSAVAEFTAHWCVSVRIARNEPEEQARREGAADGEQIVQSFRDHPYINDLARNPLMLSAICLVNWFEGGTLPGERAMLYRLCVEGLLHHWDQRRGIHSEFGLEEKLRVCRELAIAMQRADRAEYEEDKVRAVFARVLDDDQRADSLLEHIRFRTGLLIERRSGVFAFAHLTFQEYLAAQAVHEGNGAGVTPETLVSECLDPRWREVIPLYTGSGTETAARTLLRELMNTANRPGRGLLLAEAYFACERRLGSDTKLRAVLVDMVAGSDSPQVPVPKGTLEHFPTREVVEIANAHIGARVGSNASTLGEAFVWLRDNLQHVDEGVVWQKLDSWNFEAKPLLLAETLFLASTTFSLEKLIKLSGRTDLLSQVGPDSVYPFQSMIFLAGLTSRFDSQERTPQRTPTCDDDLVASTVAMKCFESALRVSCKKPGLPYPSHPVIRAIGKFAGHHVATQFTKRAERTLSCKLAEQIIAAVREHLLPAGKTTAKEPTE